MKKDLESNQKVKAQTQSWKSYNISTEVWLGLKTISNITSQGTWELMVELEDFKNMSYIAFYHRFKVQPGPLYNLSISGYDSDSSSVKDSLSGHNGHAFFGRNKASAHIDVICTQHFCGTNTAPGGYCT